MARRAQDFNVTAAYLEECARKRTRSSSERERLLEAAASYRAKAAAVQAAREQKWQKREAENASAPTQPKGG